MFLQPDPANPWSATSYTSLAISSFPTGYASVRVFVNGIPSLAVTILLASNTGPAITSSNVAAFTAGKAGSFTGTTSGAPTPAISTGTTLPAGVTLTDNLNATATLASTIASPAGVTSIALTANNGNNPNGTQTLTLTINPVLSILPAALAQADAGTAMNQLITVNGGTTPYTTVTVMGFTDVGTGLSAPTANAGTGEPSRSTARRQAAALSTSM